MHSPVDFCCSLLVWWEQEETTNIPSDGWRRRAEDLAVHHHPLPLDGWVLFIILSQNHGWQIWPYRRIESQTVICQSEKIRFSISKQTDKQQKDGRWGNWTVFFTTSKLLSHLTVEAIQLSGCQTRDKNEIKEENNEQISLLPTSTLSVVAKASH